MERVLFVCTGNTCRSPMAEALLKARAEGKIEVKSAGLFAFPGSEASEGTKTVLKEKGIELEHKSQTLGQGLLDWATLILTMTQSHKDSILSHYPHAEAKVFTIKEYTENDEVNSDVIDPFGSSVEQYRETAKELERLVEKLIKKVSSQKG